MRCFREQKDLLSKVEILINSAGLANGSGADSGREPEDWDVVIDTNIKGLLYMTRAFLPQMIAARRRSHREYGIGRGLSGRIPMEIFTARRSIAVRAITESLRLDLNGTGFV